MFLANAGVPMIYFHLPAMLYALLPVLGIEFFLAIKVFGIKWKSALKGVIAANVMSTFLGFPLLWLLWLCMMLVLPQPTVLGGQWEKIYEVTVYAAWLYPNENSLRWMIYAAGIFMLIPGFFVSVYSERWILYSVWAELPIATVRSFSWRSHILSYPLTLLVWIWHVEGF